MKEGRLYHGQVISVAPKKGSNDRFTIHILDTSKSPGVSSTTSYNVFDFMLDAKISIHDLKNKYVVVRENTNAQLSRLFLDDSIHEGKEQRLLYKFDRYMLHDYTKVDLKSVDRILYDAQLTSLLENTNQTYVRNILQDLPSYVLDYFYLHDAFQLHEFYPEDAEKIFLAYYVYELLQISKHSGL